MKKVGLTLGKFAPLHKGHQYMIERALEEVDALIVLIYDTDVIETPLHIRAAWIRSLYPRVTVYEAWDGPQDVGDTEEIRRINEDYILKVLDGRTITHFYSNEFYGDHVSKALGAVNRQVDSTRDTVPVSATMIRQEPYKYRHFVHPAVYGDLITRVVFVGAPSTGKTTLCEALAKKYHTVWIPEYGREYWEKYHVDRRVTAEQLVEIGRGHIEREDRLVPEVNRYMFVDTNAITTYMFALDYQGFALPELEMLALKAQSRYDLVFLCSDDIPYADTWERSGDVKRHRFQKQIIADLKARKLPYIELKGTLDERISTVEKVLKDFTKYDNPACLSRIV